LKALLIYNVNVVDLHDHALAATQSSTCGCTDGKLGVQGMLHPQAGSISRRPQGNLNG
jgi:hypothetical protein